MTHTPSILTSTQKNLLDALSCNQTLTTQFYLSGGTALSEFYLHHRLSEDLDFFSQQEVDLQAVVQYLQSLKSGLGIQTVDVQQSFNRNLIFLHYPNEILKTEFTYYPFPQLEQSKKVGDLRVDSLRDIAVNKIFTIYQRPRARDFIDLFRIMTQQNWELKDLRAAARAKFDTHIDPLQLAQQCLEAETIADLPHMLIPLTDEAWRSFWIEQARSLKSDALKP